MGTFTASEYRVARKQHHCRHVLKDGATCSEAVALWNARSITN